MKEHEALISSIHQASIRFYSVRPTYPSYHRSFINYTGYNVASCLIAFILPLQSKIRLPSKTLCSPPTIGMRLQIKQHYSTTYLLFGTAVSYSGFLTASNNSQFTSERYEVKSDKYDSGSVVNDQTRPD